MPEAIRRYDRGTFSYRPGEPLGDFMVYFESNQDAFTTRPAQFIIQRNFPPGIRNVDAGPLFGVPVSVKDLRSRMRDEHLHRLDVPDLRDTLQFHRLVRQQARSKCRQGRVL